MGSPSRLWLVALGLVACSKGSGSGSGQAPTGLVVLSISVPDFGQWESNRPIEFAFDQPIDFASVSGDSIHIRTSAGVGAAGTFAARPVDTNGDGLAEATDESVVVFYPSCPLADDLSDAGLTPGARYLVTLAGEDSNQAPASLLRSRSGGALAHTVVQAFETIADPASTLLDERPGAPPAPLLRAAGASSGAGCHLELGEDPSQSVFFEPGPDSGRPPAGFLAPLNLFGDRATHAAFVIVFDQPIRSTPENLARLRLEYGPSAGPDGWTPLETRVELLSSCRPAEVAARLVPLGTFPPGGFVRARIEAGFEDLVGERTPAPLEEFAVAEVARPAFASLAPAGAAADEIREEFDFPVGSPLSFADPAVPLDATQALWGDGELRANVEFVAAPAELRDFDWVVQTGQVFTFDTTATVVRGGPGGANTKTQETTGGFVLVRDLVIEQGSQLLIRGPNPFVVHASGSVAIRGLLIANGSDAQDLPVPGASTGVGGAGAAGGGAGGSGSAGTSLRGGAGAGFGGRAGGEGGESGFSAGERKNRGGGGGGGRFAANQGPEAAEGGGDGGAVGTGAESGLSPARGGAPSPDVFTDGDPSNDFFGIEPIVDASGAVVGKRRGELQRLHAGAGGGSGGDSISSGDFPPSSPALVIEGGGGGGGGGAIVIRAAGRISFGPVGRIRAIGGQGARRASDLGVDRGSCGGSGSGGLVILDSATAIDFTGERTQTWIRAIGGTRVVQPRSTGGFGGAGGPGLVQLHVPHPERALTDPESNLILPPFVRDAPNPFAAVCIPRPHILYPTAGSLSRATSRWIPLGAAGEGSGVVPESVVALAFGGIETGEGEDEGKVLTSGGRVRELAPLLGPTGLAEVGVELVPSGAVLALSGAVLAPLRASAQPISPDVYLRTPALLEGFTLRLTNVSEPDRSGDFTIADARYDDPSSRLTLALGGLPGTLAETVAGLGGTGAVELRLLPRFFRVRLDPLGADVLPDSHSVRILFQGARDDGSGRPDEANPLVDWTADVTRFGALPPGALDFVRFQVEFQVDVSADGFDPDAAAIALEYLSLPLRF